MRRIRRIGQRAETKSRENSASQRLCARISLGCYAVIARARTRSRRERTKRNSASQRLCARMGSTSAPEMPRAKARRCGEQRMRRMERIGQTHFGCRISNLGFGNSQSAIRNPQCLFRFAMPFSIRSAVPTCASRHRRIEWNRPDYPLCNRFWISLRR